MSAGFTGWTAAAFDVLLRLDGEPLMAEREKLRADRERLVRQPMIALLDAAGARSSLFEDHSVWGFQKMVWFWQHQSAVARIAPNVEIGIRFDLDGLSIRAGWIGSNAADFARYRAAVLDEGTGPQLAALIGGLEDAGLEIEGEQLQRVPRGFPRDHPRSELLRYRTMRAVRHLGTGRWLHTANAVDRLCAAGEEVRPLLAWQAAHIAGVVQPEALSLRPAG
jgi:hypothetical protein